MTKYLINLVCIIGVAGAAHAGAVANLEIAADGSAYLVFASTGIGEMTGYSIEDAANTPTGTPTITFIRPAAPEAGTGQYATGWASLDDQGPVAGENAGDPSYDWFFTSVATADHFIGEGNVDGYMARDVGTPIYIGKIFDPATIPGGGAMLTAADFGPGGRLAELEFSVTDTDHDVVIGRTQAGVDIEQLITFREPTVLTHGITPIAGAPYQETGDIGAVGTDFDATFVGAGKVAVIDLKVDPLGPGGTTVGNVTTTVFDPADGHITVDGNVLPILYGDLVEETTAGPGSALASGTLRVKAFDAASGMNVMVNATLAEVGIDTDAPGEGRYGTLGSDLVIALPGDYDVDGDSDDTDIDAISAAVIAGSPDIRYDEDNDGAIDVADRLLMITTLVERAGGGNGTIEGDADLNGAVTLADFSALSFNYGGAGGWADGDFDGNGQITLADFSILSFNYGSSVAPAPPAAPQAIPEPATLALLAVGGLAVIRRRRRA